MRKKKYLRKRVQHSGIKAREQKVREDIKKLLGLRDCSDTVLESPYLMYSSSEPLFSSEYDTQHISVNTMKQKNKRCQLDGLETGIQVIILIDSYK